MLQRVVKRKMTKRIAVIVLETLSAGEAANVAALLTGQIGCSYPGFFSPVPVHDAGGTLVQNIQLFDLFQGGRIPKGYKNFSLPRFGFCHVPSFLSPPLGTMQ